MSQNPFADLVPGGQQPAAPQQQTIGGRRVVGGVPPSERRAERDQQLQEATTASSLATAELQRQQTALAIEEKRREAQAEQQKMEKLAASQDAAISNLRRVIEKIDSVALDSADNNGWFETGFTGSLTRDISGTAASDLAANIQTIDANSAFSALQAMRDASPTGGALGQVTERELDLLKSTIANLNPNQSQQQFLTNLTEAKRAYLDMLGRLDPDAAAEFAEKPGIRFDEQGRGYLTTVSGGEERDVQDPLGFDAQPQPPDGGGNNYTLGLAQGLGDAVEGLSALPGMVINPIGQALYNVTGYGDQRYDLGDILRGAAGLPESEEGIGRTMRQSAASALSVAGAARSLGGLVSNTVGRNALQTVGRTPLRDTVAGASAGAGAEVGQEIGGPVGGFVGTIGGGLLGYGGANALTNAGRVGTSPASPVGQASARQGVDLLPSDAGGEVTRMLTSGARISPLSAGPIRNAARNNQQQMQNATQRAMADAPEGVTSDRAGQSVRDAAVRYTEETGRRGEALYTRAFKLAGNVKSIKPVKTIAAIDEQLARLRQNPVAEQQVKELELFRDKIASGVSIQGLRDARTALSQGVFDGKLRSGPEKGMWKQILSNVADDIDGGLRSVGRGDAADAFKTADTFWRSRVEHLDEVLQPLVDPKKGGEQIIETIESMARGKQGGNARLSRLLANMKPQEAAGVRGTIIDRLGKATAGQQDAAGEAFSPATFLTNWNKLTPQAKASLFQGKQRQDLDDLALLAQNMKGTQQMANHSNTALALTSGGNAVLGAGLAAYAHPVFAILGATTQYGMGRLLASPGFARILTRTAKAPPAVANRKISEQLGIIAGQGGAAANEARALQQAMNDNFGALAAQEPSEGQQ